MKLKFKPWLLLAALAGGGALSGCVDNPAQSKIRIQPDFGRAVSQDLAAQIANPDAGRDAGPPPPLDGARANLAVQRYRQNEVIQPASIGASGSSSGYGGIGAGTTPGGTVAAASGSSGQ